MFDAATISFGVFLLIMFSLDIAMFFSLGKEGDERRQMIVGKTSNFTLVAIMGSLVLDIFEDIIRQQVLSVNPFSLLTVAAVVYFISLFYYRKKHGG